MANAALTKGGTGSKGTQTASKDKEEDKKKVEKKKADDDDFDY